MLAPTSVSWLNSPPEKRGSWRGLGPNVGSVRPLRRGQITYSRSQVRRHALSEHPIVASQGEIAAGRDPNRPA